MEPGQGAPLSPAFTEALARKGLAASCPWYLKENTLVVVIHDLETMEALSVVKFWSPTRSMDSATQCLTEWEHAMVWELRHSGVVHTIGEVVFSTMCRGAQVYSWPCSSNLDALVQPLGAALRGPDPVAAAAAQQQLLDLASELVMTSAVALSTYDRLGVVHRDIKPSNVFVLDLPSGQHHLLLADHGIATRVQDSNSAGDAGWPHRDLQDAAGQTITDPDTIAEATDAKYDVWASMLTVLWTLCGGRRPPEVDHGLVAAAADAAFVHMQALAAEQTAAAMLASVQEVAAAAAAAGGCCPQCVTQEQLDDAASLASIAAEFVSRCAAKVALRAASVSSLACLHAEIAPMVEAAEAAAGQAQQHAATVQALVQELALMPRSSSDSSSSSNGGPRLVVPEEVLSAEQSAQLKAWIYDFQDAKEEEFTARRGSYNWKAGVKKLCREHHAPHALWHLLRHTVGAPREERLTPQQLLQHPFVVARLEEFMQRLPQVVQHAEDADDAMRGAMLEVKSVLHELKVKSFAELLAQPVVPSEDDSQAEAGSTSTGDGSTSTGDGSTSIIISISDASGGSSASLAEMLRLLVGGGAAEAEEQGEEQEQEGEAEEESEEGAGGSDAGIGGTSGSSSTTTTTGGPSSTMGPTISTAAAGAMAAVPPSGPLAAGPTNGQPPLLLQLRVPPGFAASRAGSAATTTPSSAEAASAAGSANGLPSLSHLPPWLRAARAESVVRTHAHRRLASGVADDGAAAPAAASAASSAASAAEVCAAGAHGTSSSSSSSSSSSKDPSTSCSMPEVVGVSAVLAASPACVDPVPADGSSWQLAGSEGRSSSAGGRAATSAAATATGMAAAAATAAGAVLLGAGLLLAATEVRNHRSRLLLRLICGPNATAADSSSGPQGPLTASSTSSGNGGSSGSGDSGSLSVPCDAVARCRRVKNISCACSKQGAAAHEPATDTGASSDRGDGRLVLQVGAQAATGAVAADAAVADVQLPPKQRWRWAADIKAAAGGALAAIVRAARPDGPAGGARESCFRVCVGIMASYGDAAVPTRAAAFPM